MELKKAIKRIRFVLSSIKNPVFITRLTDCNGKRKIVVVQKSIFGAKAIGKFEIVKEFDPNSQEPNWEEIGFRSFHYREKRAVTETPATAGS
ncbi:hypothetical protein D1641_09615 [Colidextribacter sp. OB.20]|uniref:hypothetical protein n=1 Tax=Colidextribacter sp. OB.20 TaxID=2304568 RepID=UPI00137138A4|nr:hypothetical protein [Colidextribacter sp. OB.20]NBI10265.1 hypothetical protein [Colidextribacter sp. OB.20]